jgi:membrane-bound inhibitor of C-type lysozyme
MRASARSSTSILFILGMFFLVTIAARAADAQGINCTSPTSTVQKTICGDADTSRNETLAYYASKNRTMDPVTFTCEDHTTLTISFVTGAKPLARVRQGEQFWTLPQVKSASGARYANGTVSVWNKGKDLTFQLGNRKTQCSTK